MHVFTVLCTVAAAVQYFVIVLKQLCQEMASLFYPPAHKVGEVTL